MKRIEQEVKDLRAAVEQLKREVLNLREPVRHAAPLAARRGWFLGIVREDFTKGEDEFIKCDIWIWSATDDEWRKVPGLVNEEVRDWFLNDDTEIEKDTKLKIEWYETTWVATAIYCEPVNQETFKSRRSPGSELPDLLSEYEPSYEGIPLESAGGYQPWG